MFLILAAKRGQALSGHRLSFRHCVPMFNVTKLAAKACIVISLKAIRLNRDSEMMMPAVAMRGVTISQLSLKTYTFINSQIFYINYFSTRDTFYYYD